MPSRSRLTKAAAIAGLFLSVSMVTPAAQAANKCTHSSSMSTNGWSITWDYFQWSTGWRYNGSILVHRHYVKETVSQWLVGVDSERYFYIDCAN